MMSCDGNLRRATWLVVGPLVLAACVAVAYGHARDAGFLMDDDNSVVVNRSIRSLWPLLPVVWYGHQDGRTVDGRPLLNLSFAVNRALLGPAPASYRVVNDAIHWANAVLLFLLVEGLLAGSTVAGSLRNQRMAIALTAAVLWIVHPICVGAVTYIAQRAESLAAFGILLSISLAWRGIAGGTNSGWGMVPLVVASACSGAVKETAVVIPLVTIVLDRAIASASWREVARHWRWHLAAAASWPVVAAMLTVWGGRGASAGFASAASPWRYLLTQARAIWIYLGRLLWPSVNVFDYGDGLATGLAEAWPWLLATVGLVVGVCIGFLKFPRAFCGPVLFLLLLGPTSSFIPVKTQTIAEHRLYLPAAALIAWGVAGVWMLADRAKVPGWGRWAVVAMVAGCLAARTHRLNDAYLDPQQLWRTSLEASPGNERALVSLAVQMIAKGRFAEAEALLDEAEAVGTVPRVLYLARSLAAKDQGDFESALRHCAAAVRVEPGDPRCHSEQALILWKLGRLDDAMQAADRALAIDPLFAPALVNRGNVWLDLGRREQAEEDFAQAVALEPWRVAGWIHLGVVRYLAGDLDAAHVALARAEQLDPKNANAAYNHGNVLAAQGDVAAAIAAYGRAIASDPGMRDAYFNRGATRLGSGDAAGAAADFRAYRERGGSQPVPVTLGEGTP